MFHCLKAELKVMNKILETAQAGYLRRDMWYLPASLQSFVAYKLSCVAQFTLPAQSLCAGVTDLCVCIGVGHPMLVRGDA